MSITKTQLSAPLNCDNCKGYNFGLTSNSVIYGIEKGLWPYCYYCDDCGAMVGCHPNTHNPMGLMAIGSTRRKRAKLHEIFDPIWHLKYLTRDEAYQWLAKELDLPTDKDCHIAQLSIDKLQQALDIMRVHFDNGYSQFKRRKQKNEQRKLARFARQDGKISRRKSS